jgi:hypothetical protein
MLWANSFARLFISGLQFESLMGYGHFSKVPAAEACSTLSDAIAMTRSSKSPGMLLITPIMLAIVCVVLLALAAPQSAFALHRVDPHHHRILRRLRGILWNPLFRPSHDSLLRQNEEIDRIELPRIQDDTQLEALKASGELVAIPESESLKIEPSLDPSRRFCRPWTRDFVTDLSEVYYRQFHEQIQLNSAVRTVKTQKKLRRRNRNAAPAEGETASSHLAGVTVDLQRRGMTNEQIRFVEHYLFYLHALSLVEPEEERHHWCFHVMVSDRYADWRQTQTIFPVPPLEQPVTPPAVAAALTAAN